MTVVRINSVSFWLWHLAFRQTVTYVPAQNTSQVTTFIKLKLQDTSFIVHSPRRKMCLPQKRWQSPIGILGVEMPWTKQCSWFYPKSLSPSHNHPFCPLSSVQGRARVQEVSGQLLTAELRFLEKSAKACHYQRFGETFWYVCWKYQLPPKRW
jgi:hypothetical protein